MYKIYIWCILPGDHQLHIPKPDSVVDISDIDVVVVVRETEDNDDVSSSCSVDIWDMGGLGYFNCDGLSKSKNGSFDPEVVVLIVDGVFLFLDLWAIHWSQLKAPFVDSSKISNIK